MEERKEEGGRTGKLEGHDMSWGGFRQAAGWQCQNQSGSITSHVLLALKHYEAVAAVGFLFLISLFVGMGITDDANLSRSAYVHADTEKGEKDGEILTRSMGPNRPNSRSKSFSSAL